MAGVTLLRRVLIAVGVAAMLVALAGVGAHFSGLVSTRIVLVASFTPLLVLAGVLAVALLLAARQRVLAGLAVVVVALGAWTQAPLFRGTAANAADGGVSITLMQANIRLGEADPQALVDTVRAEDVDVLTVVELTPGAARGLAAAGLQRLLPHSYLRPREGGGGAAIFAKYPLSEPAELDGFALHNIRALADIPGAGSVAVYALHPVPPYPQPAWKWDLELRRLRGVFAAERHPLIVGADFNSTYDHRRFRDLLGDSAPGATAAPMFDAAEHVGAGIVTTYPADRWYPPLLAIDRILSRGATPVSFHRVDLPGSDHRGVVGGIRLPRAD
ncbi:endonuclease/exonuclease/phosphatase family protein [Mycolicibacterium palauense]|uniref:endonuclease/exonuclease/phosphatase family protein n=1 Tax=Mycolicibacterium palauense TaxID=2034511 RepID=UPI00159BD93B